MRPGAFVLSLDFELHWGVRDHTPVAAYRENLLGAREAIPEMLRVFERREIAATWATVGFLFAESKRELEKHCPDLLPSYRNRRMSPYEGMHEVGGDEKSDPYHFAPTLIRKIAETPRQELATHTFSHYYCLEPGQTPAQFDADLRSAEAIGRSYGHTLRSIVFPRNQFDGAYLEVAARRGVEAYRSSGRHWAYRGRNKESWARRAFRLADAYWPLARRGAAEVAATDAVVDVPATAFLRPYTPSLRRFERRRFQRLSSMMSQAAARGGLFHLWWHPHNFGRHRAENLRFLEALLDHFSALRKDHGMQSLAMVEAARRAPPCRSEPAQPRAMGHPPGV
jgi:hypothetical protein